MADCQGKRKCRTLPIFWRNAILLAPSPGPEKCGDCAKHTNLENPGRIEFIIPITINSKT